MNTFNYTIHKYFVEQATDQRVVQCLSVSFGFMNILL